MNDIIKLLNKYNRDRFSYINKPFRMSEFLKECFNHGDIDREFFIRNKKNIIKEWVDYYYWCLKIKDFTEIYSPDEMLLSRESFSLEILYKYLTDSFSEEELINSAKIFSTAYLVKILMSYELSSSTIEFFKEEFKNNEKILETIANWQVS